MKRIVHIVSAGLLFLGQIALLRAAAAQTGTCPETRVEIDSHGWRLIGDLTLPPGNHPLPAALMLNQAAGDRTVYAELSSHLCARGVASLRVDLRAHGESVNLGRFVPGEQPRSLYIWDAEEDVISAQNFLSSHPGIDDHRIGIVGASYSGEEMAEAGRLHGFAKAYVALSPGSFSEESVAGIDSSGASWLFVVSRAERFLKEITASVRAESQTVELVVLPGTEHASELLLVHPGLAERLAVWLKIKLE